MMSFDAVQEYDKLASSKMRKLKSSQAGKLTRWQIDKLPRWQDDKKTGWQEEMTRWADRMRRQDDIVAKVADVNQNLQKGAKD